MSGSLSGLSGLTAGENYFLSPSVAGQLTVTEPTTVGHVSVPVMVATSATAAIINIMRGVVVGGANVRTSVGLANNATTTVQSFAAYEAAELTGWVTISATTPLKFYLQAQVAKNGAGTDYNVAWQATGDTYPVGFNVTITAAGLLQIVMPNVTGFTSASVNYALNAPAVGTTFPLSVDEANVVNRYQEKYFNGSMLNVSSVLASTVDSNFKFSNLVIGRRYKIYLKVNGDRNAAGLNSRDMLVLIRNGATTITRGSCYAYADQWVGHIVIDHNFVATATTIEFLVTTNIGAAFSGDGTALYTMARLSDITNAQTVTTWS